MRADITGCTIFVGGSMGRNPRHGIKIVELANEEQLFSVLEKTVDYYRKYGLDGERLGELLGRLGIKKYREEVLS